MEVVSSHNYCLDTPSEIHDVFHTNLLHSVVSDPFLSQKIDNYQPLSIIEKNNELEYKIKSIEPISVLENTTALDTYDQFLPPMNTPTLE
ncbi:hypothetical protein ACJ72_08388 [Emergomyces africanus]|uniref:Uncharacterized protein n=1 Tax=Emergomyces africanus TaxID=1955775 RepID=A0A1B7NKK9_9EURO|nr:hypothetical protein ACJ72_08388 [Emergomyces africanus]